MANWKQVTLTNAGRELAAAVTAGQLKLNITEIWFGSGTPANLETATDLAAKKIKADIVSIKQQDMECLITFRVSNEGQASAVVLSEMGFYAKGTSGSNILFSVTTDDQPATLPAQGSGSVYRQTMTMAFGYSNAENVEIDSTIIDGTPEEDVAAMIQEHDESASAHQDFVGATAAEAGARGMVPAPPAGAQNKVLTGGEIWTLIEELNVALGTIDKPQTNTAALKTLLGGIVYMINAITGQNDWKTLPAASIATILSNLQGSLAVNWDGNKFTVPALGVSGLMAQNGYINFGKLFGGLIVQWGRTYTQTGALFTTFPIQFANEVYAIVCTEADAGVWKPTQAVISGIANGATTLGCTIHSRWIDNGVVILAGETITYVAIGR